MQNQKTRDYTNAIRKRRAIETVFNPNGCKRIVGLAGPHPVQCVKRWIEAGFEHITVYENNVDTFIKQKRALSKHYPHINLNLGDILELQPIENVFYELDLCCTLKNLKNIERFQGNFMLTLCLRGMNRELTENQFISMRNEKLVTSYNMIEEKYGLTVKEIFTGKSTYHTICYRDPDSPPMLIITKI